MKEWVWGAAEVERSDSLRPGGRREADSVRRDSTRMEDSHVDGSTAKRTKPTRMGIPHVDGRIIKRNRFPRGWERDTRRTHECVGGSLADVARRGGWNWPRNSLGSGGAGSCTSGSSRGSTVRETWRQKSKWAAGTGRVPLKPERDRPGSRDREGCCCPRPPYQS
jgi:hypothetical protein